MKIVLFYHSLVSDWNHGNAHFLRGIATELTSRGHDVVVYEPRNGWSLENLMKERGYLAVEQFLRVYPGLDNRYYQMDSLDLDEALDKADLVVVHEWNEHELVRAVGNHRRNGGTYRLLFHDTHHRSVTDPGAMAAYDLSAYDGVLAYGEVIRQIYLDRGWIGRAWTWHEAADIRVFHPLPDVEPDADLVWIGNWGDDERTEEIYQYLVEPSRRLGLKADVYGVRYPQEAVSLLKTAGLSYGGWLPNFEVPQVFARHRVTVHIPRRPYVVSLPGIPTIRPFEAMACRIPLVSTHWNDVEGLFTPGVDFLVAHTPGEMESHLKRLLNDPDFAREIADRGYRTILDRHTCAHRVDQLMSIVGELGIPDDTATRNEILRAISSPTLVP